MAIAAPDEVAAGAADVFDGAPLEVGSLAAAITLAVRPVAFLQDDGTEGAAPLTKLTAAH